MFRFKQFTVEDDGCAMKVGTDGVLLGAWVPIRRFRDVQKCLEMMDVLDVGTGSGLIALMVAQRMEEEYRVLGIDVDGEAVCQAAANFAASPWAEWLQVKQMSLQELGTNEEAQGTFDLIVSNPPYFVDSLKNPDAGRRLARHTDTLPFSELIACSARLLSPNGTLAVIVPAEAEEQLTALGRGQGLYPYYITHVCTRKGKQPKRVLMAFTFGEQVCREDVLCLMDEKGDARSAAYQDLCREFYL